MVKLEEIGPYKEARSVIGVRDDDLLELLTDKDAIPKDALPVAREAKTLTEHHEDVVRDGELVRRVDVRQRNDRIGSKVQKLAISERLRLEQL